MERPDARTDSVVTLFLLLSILSALLLFYIPMIKNWFFSDDIQWIWSSATLQFRDIFLVPEKYRAMASNFTPMLGASFKIDWTLFGMNPAGYSIHSILSLLATAIVFFFFLRLYVTRKTALTGVLLFLLNPITLSCTQWFSTRHYIEGLFWALLSLCFFITAERKEKISPSAGLFYLLSSLNKEVYVVLPAVAFVLSTGNLWKRLRKTLPLWLGLIIYALWRLWMMKGVGGYPSNQPLNFTTIPTLFCKAISFFSVQWFGTYYALLYLFLIGGLLFAPKRATPLLIFFLLIVPVLPVTNIMGEHYDTGRYFLHISIFLICMVCLFVEYQTSRGARLQRNIILLFALLAMVLFVKKDLGISSAIRDERLKAKEAATVFVNSHKTYIRSEQPLWFYEGLRRIYRDFLGREIATRLVPPETFLKYASPEKLAEIKASGIDIPYDGILEFQKKLGKGPLTVRITLDEYKLTWDFGPCKDAKYTLLRGPLSGLYYNSSELNPEGVYMLGKEGENGRPGLVYIRILSRPDEGREVISPEFELRIPGRQRMEYRAG